MSAVAPPTAAGESDPTTAQQPEGVIAVRVVPAAAEDAEEPAVHSTSFLLQPASLAEGTHVLLVQPTTGTADSSGGLQALLVKASRRDDDAPNQQARDNDSRKAARELRGWLMVLATVIASITYASGLTPPGGFLDMDTLPRTDPDYGPATPVLRFTSRNRYSTFYYCNTAALALSLSIIVLLASQDLRRLAKMKVLEILVALDVLALLIAYIVGSTFGLRELGICAGLVIIVPVALVVMSSGVCGKYFWDEL
jgi:hypothetical protein